MILWLCNKYIIDIDICRCLSRKTSMFSTHRQSSPYTSFLQCCKIILHRRINFEKIFLEKPKFVKIINFESKAKWICSRLWRLPCWNVGLEWKNKTLDIFKTRTVECFTESKKIQWYIVEVDEIRTPNEDIQTFKSGLLFYYNELIQVVEFLMNKYLTRNMIENYPIFGIKLHPLEVALGHFKSLAVLKFLLEKHVFESNRFIIRKIKPGQINMLAHSKQIEIK